MIDEIEEKHKSLEFYEELYEKPMHFNTEQINWIKQYSKKRYEIGYGNAIDDFAKVLLTNDVADKSVVRRVCEQMKIQIKDLFYRKG